MKRHPKSTYSPDIATIISQRLGISFLCDFDRQKELLGNVCFAHSPELRPEYREFFTLSDLTGYLYSLVHDPSKKELFPPDADYFWKLVEIGNKFLNDPNNENGLPKISIVIRPLLKHNWVTKIKFGDTGKLWISDMQYLTGISTEVWEMRLGGEYPAKQWLENYLDKELPAYKLDTYTRLLEHLDKVHNFMDKMVKRH